MEAEMKTPGAASEPIKLDLAPTAPSSMADQNGIDLEFGQTLQRIVDFDLKEEGTHVLAVTIIYYEASDLGGRTRTFRKLYQFVCKPALIVRTKPGPLPSYGEGRSDRSWVLEAQLENCSEETIQVQRVVLITEPGLVHSDCNTQVTNTAKPVLHPGEIEQVCFVVREARGEETIDHQNRAKTLGVMGISWTSRMGHRGYISTGKLTAR
jgi:hypothetical protein